MAQDLTEIDYGSGVMARMICGESGEGSYGTPSGGLRFRFFLLLVPLYVNGCSAVSDVSFTARSDPVRSGPGLG